MKEIEVTYKEMAAKHGPAYKIQLRHGPLIKAGKTTYWLEGIITFQDETQAVSHERITLTRNRGRLATYGPEIITIHE